MFKKIFKFIIGYVIIEVTGLNKERFVGMCLHNGFKISDVEPLENGFKLTIIRRDFYRIRRIVRKCKVRVRILEVHSLKSRKKRYGKRYGFFAAAFLVCIFFLTAPHYIWCVQIDGEYDADDKAIREILKIHGVYKGARKSQIGDLSDIKDDIVLNIDCVNWAWLYVEGTKARLQIQEASKPPQVVDTTKPSDIIAGYGGYITKADVKRGERHVNKGDVVSPGDVLVSGKTAVFNEWQPEKYIYVHSEAEIKAETIRMESGSFSRKQKLKIKTGRIKRRIAFMAFGKYVPLYKDLSGNFEEYETEENKKVLMLPIWGNTGCSAILYNVYEMVCVENKLSEREVLETAKEVLEERICKKLGIGAEKLSEKMTYKSHGDIYDVELRVHFKENIGIEVPIEE